jgi:3D (Asp-Asp-Asp) domain-containing protein
VDGVNSRWPLLCTALLAGLLVTGSTPARGGAETAPGLSSEAQSLRRAESAALLQLYAAESALAGAEADLRRLEARSAELERTEQSARRQAEIVRRSLAASQVRIATLLRDLYVRGEPDAIAIVFGATSLDEAMTGIDGLQRATALNERLAAQAARRARLLVRVHAELASRRARLDGARAEARAAERRLALAVAAKRASVTAIRRQRSVTEQRLAALQAQAHEAEQRSAKITAAATAAASSGPLTSTPSSSPSTTISPAPTSSGTRTLVVDAVAYHLAGSTASGLPVGVGVIAVDPSVIPLGTRVLVPGYGPAVAADVGGAVRGNIIDLWMPSTKQALAWGRRTVTITIYG